MRLPSELRAESDELFREQIAPLLETHCVQCHRAQAAESGLRLDHPSGVIDGGDRGPAVQEGDPNRSWLYRAVHPEDDP